MNHDFSQYPELRGPIVLLIGGGHGDADRLKERLYNVLVLEANVQTVEFIHLDLESYWWDDPTLHDNMHDLLDLFPRKSKASATKWIETDGFVREIRKILARLVETSTSLERLPKNWPELVSLVILDVDTETTYVQRVFDGWFTNAKFRAYRGRDHTVEIWRDGIVVPIDRVTKPTASEAICMKVSELPGLDATTIAWLERAGDPSVHETVLHGREWLSGLGLGKIDLDQIGGALVDVDLGYGMTRGEIAAIRGIQPTAPELLAFLATRCDQLGLKPPQIGSKLVNSGLTTIAHLVRADGDQVRAILGDDDSHCKAVANWVREHNLKLGMTASEIATSDFARQAS